MSTTIALNGAGASVGSKPIIRSRANARPKKKLKGYNVVLDERGVAMVEKNKDRIDPSTQAEVFRVSLQLLDLMLDELDEGATFFIQKTKGGKKEPFVIME